MRIFGAIAFTLALAAFSSTAQAAYVFGSGAAVSAQGANITNSGAVGNMNGAYDAVFYGFNLNTGNGVQTVTVTWNIGALDRSGFRLFIDGNTTAASVTQVTLFDGTTTQSDNTVYNLSAASGAAVTIDIADGPGFFPAIDFSNLQTIALVFTLDSTGGNSRLKVDAIANPEPGTIALFGLGALALVGARRRRRRARAAA